MRWVLDSSAILEVARGSSDYRDTFSDMTDLVDDGEMTFADKVPAELRRTDEEGPACLWADTVKAQRQHKAPKYSVRRWVADNVDGLIDPDDLRDAAPEVVAQAKELLKDHEELTVVTEDVYDKPSRKAMSTVCDELGIPWVPVETMVATAGLRW